MMKSNFYSTLFSILTTIGLSGIGFSIVMFSSFIIIDYDAVVNKKLSDTVVLDGFGFNGLQSGNFVMHINSTVANPALQFKNSNNGILYDISIDGYNKESIMYVSFDSNIPFFNCWYKNIPCVFVAKWIPQFQLEYLKNEIGKDTIYCDEDNNCFDKPQKGMNLV